MKKILYGISGIGNGHANREMPVIEELVKENEIMIFCHDDSLRVMTAKFGNNPKVKIVPVGLTFIVGSTTGLNFAATAAMKHNLNPEVFRASYQALDKVVSEWGKADLVITDYEPLSAMYAYAYHVPLVTIDQQSKFLYGDLPESLGGFTYADEVARLSMFFPTAHKRIACTFFTVNKRDDAAEVLLVPPTIKKTIIDLKDKRVIEEGKINILFYVSSAKEFPLKPEAVFEVIKKEDKTIFHLFVPKDRYDEFNKLKSTNSIVYPHGDDHFLEIMGKANGIISTAGHSLLSEAMFLSIPVYAIPVEPYEQHLNAWAIANNNFGVSDPNLTNVKLKEFITNLSKYAENIRNDRTKLMHGVGQEVIVDYIKKEFLTEKKKVCVFSPPFSGHLNILKEFIKDQHDGTNFKLIITGWKNIKPDLAGIDPKIVEVIEDHDLNETDPALWTFERAANLLPRCLDMVKNFGPDLIIYDFFSIEGYLAGRILNLPYWCSVPAMIGPFENQKYRDDKFGDEKNRKAVDFINENYKILIKKEEVEMLSDGFLLPGKINLIWSFKELTPDNFTQGRAKNNYCFVGNPRGDNYEKTDFKNPKPLIYFSLGTVVMNNLWNQQAETRERLTQFFKKLAELWSGKNWQIIFVTQGKKILEKYPDNWWVYDNVDQVEILSRADLFVTHGGSNSFHEAVMQRVPMAVLPFFGDQLLVAAQTEKLGLGVKAGGSTNIDTHGTKDFINEELAIKLTALIEKMLTQPDYARKYLYLDLNAYPVKALINGEIEIDNDEILFGQKPPEGKTLDYYASLTRVHVPVDKKIPDDLSPLASDYEFFKRGIQFYARRENTWLPVNADEVGVKSQKLMPLKSSDYRRVVLTSQSPIKIAAVESVLKIKCEAVDPKLSHDEQLIGIENIAKAAEERLEAIIKIKPEADLYISMVSGLIFHSHQYLDVGVVLVADKEGHRVWAKSAPLALPLSAAQKAKLRGFAKFTVGKVLGEEMASHVYDTDPHGLITQGKESRKEFLAEALKRAVDHLNLL